MQCTIIKIKKEQYVQIYLTKEELKVQETQEKINEYKNKKLNILIEKNIKPGLLLFLITAIQVLYVVCEN